MINVENWSSGKIGRINPTEIYEPILTNGRCIGHITSSNYGYAVEKVIAYGYLPAEHVSIGTELEVRYMGRSYPAIVAAEPRYDPKSKRMKADSNHTTAD